VRAEEIGLAILLALVLVCQLGRSLGRPNQVT